tara:strand:+ start:133 stop:543 length:411 start_codon:yes stop_codon:yes gene_type:complete
MASILKVDEMQGVTSAGDITITSEGGAATQSLQQGLAKVWCGWNTITSTSILDSNNVASLTDNGTAYTTINFSSNLSTTGYSLTASAGTASYRVCLDTVGSNTDLTSSCNTYATRTDTGAGLDFDKGSSAIHGDLA